MQSEILASTMLMTATGLPVDKFIAMLVFYGVVGLFSTVSVFLPRETLVSLSHFIGTSNPTIARMVCALAAVVGWGAVVVTLLFGS